MRRFFVKAAMYFKQNINALRYCDTHFLINFVEDKRHLATTGILPYDAAATH